MSTDTIPVFLLWLSTTYPRPSSWHRPIVLYLPLLSFRLPCCPSPVLLCLIIAVIGGQGCESARFKNWNGNCYSGWPPEAPDSTTLIAVITETLEFGSIDHFSHSLDTETSHLAKILFQSIQVGLIQKILKLYVVQKSALRCYALFAHRVH